MSVLAWVGLIEIVLILVLLADNRREPLVLLYNLYIGVCPVLFVKS